MERLKSMKECLMSTVQAQISGNLNNVDTHELGEAIDMIKDLAEAMYYCSVVEAMDEEYWRDMDKSENKMYYTPRLQTTTPRYQSEPYYEERYSGKSPIKRKMYMETKELHPDKNKQKEQLEDYVKELSWDITEMLHDASPEDKQLIKTRLTEICNKL